MKSKKPVIIILLFSIFSLIGILEGQDLRTVKWEGKAELLYNKGFMHMLMKHSKGGVSLFNMELIENDAAGAGFSEKGVSSDTIYGEVRGRKILYLEDSRAEKAFIVIFTVHQGKYPLKFKINGKEGKINNWNTKENREVYRWTEFPADWLKKGDNVIDLYCPQAETRKEGWELYISRADEFKAGGGDPDPVGETSFKSFDGGKSWKKSPFGSNQSTRAEYSVRLSLDRYVSSGWLCSPVIDTWRGNIQDTLIPQTEVYSLTLKIQSEMPDGTHIRYFYRMGSDMSPFGKDWEEYVCFGSGHKATTTIKRKNLKGRFIQLKAELSTKNPLNSPLVKSAEVISEIRQKVPVHPNIHVVRTENPVIKYSSLDWQWEKWNRPEFAKLKKRESLDDVISDSETQFEAQLKLLDYVSKRWVHSNSLPQYPESWDALGFLQRLDKLGSGGMCMSFNNTLAGILTAYGWQARMVNIVGHEVCEVWNDQYGKWIFLDADNNNNYIYDRKTAEPQSLLELHRKYLDVYFPDRPINWMKDLITPYPKLPEELPVKIGSLTHQKSIKMTGFLQAAFMRMIPRNNWFEKPFPRPLNHGVYWWPWNGYVNWYDKHTPPKRQYSWHTDRPRDMWPDLNLVHINATVGYGNDRIFLRFETYTPNFDHFEINVNDQGWKTIEVDRYSWILVPGKNIFKVRAVNMLGVKGKSSLLVINHGNAPYAAHKMK